MSDGTAKDEIVPTTFRARSFERFSRRLRDRLEKGSQEYGEMSFGRPVVEVVEEIEEELLDVAGWSWIVWEQLQHLKRRGLGK